MAHKYTATLNKDVDGWLVVLKDEDGRRQAYAVEQLCEELEAIADASFSMDRPGDGDLILKLVAAARALAEEST